MSFVISRKQYLAPNEEKSQYKPIVFEDDKTKLMNIDVAFGHPLYTTVADIFCISSASDEPQEIPIIPDGCMTLVIKTNGNNTIGYLCGAIDEIRKISIFPGDFYMFMKFFPGMGQSLVQETVGDITNLAIPLKGNMQWGDQILSIFERDTTLDERIRLISKVIRVQFGTEPCNYMVKYCIERIFQTQGNIRVDTLAEETGFTSRYIGKSFEKCVGVSPKLFSQIVRLQLSMSKIMSDKNTLLVDIAIDSGFFDHAHMNRMFKKLVHCSSGEFRKNYFGRLDYSKVNNYIPVD